MVSVQGQGVTTSGGTEPKRPYRTPQLRTLGTLRELTLSTGCTTNFDGVQFTKTVATP
jgi:hypothetical protein